MGKMVTDTVDHMDSISSLTVNMHDLESASRDEDSRDSVISDSLSLNGKDVENTLESVEKVLAEDDKKKHPEAIV